MQKLTAAVSALQSQIEAVPGIIRKVTRDEATVTVTANPPGTQRPEDTLTFSVLFVTPCEYPASQAWLMSDNEALCDMLCAVADEFVSGGTLELVLTRVLSLFGHEPDAIQDLFSCLDTFASHTLSLTLSV